ncbi:MAG: serine/threonine protein kinase, partial [Actinomycetota bacterium]|nr:serine/threonine protein kinase [Actinomycetota bacterium]
MSDARLLAGRYRLESVLGRGGMGQVWLGRDETLGRAVAVKEIRLPTALSDDERDALCTRMLREARLTARLSHPGVVTVYDVVSEDGRPFIVMELLRVPTLADEVAANGPLAAGRVAAIGLELLTALDAAHREGIVHRDVKPSNVLLADKRVVLSDFGIATSESDPRMTATGLIVGSPTYMSPERLRGSPTGPETDMWSLGATLYAAAEGQPPFDAGTTMGTVLAVLNDPLTGPSVGGQLATVLDGLLDKDPGSRLDSQQAARLLRRVADRSGDDDA